MRSSIWRDVKLKAFVNFLFDFFIDFKNSTSYEYKSRSAKSGSDQFLPVGIDTNTLPKQMVTNLNVNIAYREVYHLVD